MKLQDVCVYIYIYITEVLDIFSVSLDFRLTFQVKIEWLSNILR